MAGGAGWGSMEGVSVLSTTPGGTAPEVASPELTALEDLVADGDVVVLSRRRAVHRVGHPRLPRTDRARARPATPMTYQVFTGDPAARRRYWARSHVGWHVIADARPNDGHRAVAALQRAGLLRGIVTQNVDGLHTAAGAQRRRRAARRAGPGGVPRLRRPQPARRARRPAARGQRRLAGPFAGVDGVKPDGDVDLPEDVLDTLRRRAVHRVRRACSSPTSSTSARPCRPTGSRARFALVEGAGALVVLGSSLTVMSGYRFVLRAAKLGIPVALVNQGPTRGDAHAAVRVDAPLGQVLPALARRLAG